MARRQCQQPAIQSGVFNHKINFSFYWLFLSVSPSMTCCKTVTLVEQGLASVSEPPGYVDSKMNIWLDVQPVETPREPNQENTLVNEWATCLLKNEGRESKMHLGIRSILGLTFFFFLHISSTCSFNSMSNTCIFKL